MPINDKQTRHAWSEKTREHCENSDLVPMLRFPPLAAFVASCMTVFIHRAVRALSRVVFCIEP